MAEDSEKWHRINSILVVDDDDNWCYLSKKILERAGFNKPILIAKNGAEALNLLQQNADTGTSQPDLIFLDIKMPVMDGFDFLEAVTTSEEINLTQTRIYMCSSSFNPKDKEKAYLYPIAGYISKPLTKEILEEII